ncbi:MAG: hypothetical protein AB1847_10465 [bacterium]
MRKRRERAGIILMGAALCIALLFSIAEAAMRPVSVKVTVNGKLQLIPLQGNEAVYENGETEILLAPQTILKSLTGTSSVKIGIVQLLLDKDDSMALVYGSGDEPAFKCIGGSIEAICGDTNRKFVEGDVVALNSLSGGGEAQKVANSRARVAERVKGLDLYYGPVQIGQTGNAPGNILPYQGGPYNPRLPWLTGYGEQNTWTWTSASPYW